MPQGDKKGPQGEGPMTGRRLGYCTGNNRPGSEAGSSGSGIGLGRNFHESIKQEFRTCDKSLWNWK